MNSAHNDEARADLPDDLTERVRAELIVRLEGVAGLEQLELDGIEPAPRSPIWR